MSIVLARLEPRGCHPGVVQCANVMPYDASLPSIIRAGELPNDRKASVRTSQNISDRHSITSLNSAVKRLPVREPGVLLFGQKLRYLRQSSSMTQTALAQALNVITQAHLSHLEAGRKEPSLQLVVNLSALFGVTIDYLLKDDVPVEAIEYRTRGSISAMTWMGVFATQLRRLRKTQGLTQVQLSQQVGLKTQAHISLLETQRSEPSIDLVVQLAQLFAVPIDDLFISPTK